VSPTLQTPAADSVRAALDRVFSAPKYDWEAPSDPFSFVRELLYDLATWLEGLRESHPAVYVVLLGLLTGMLLAILFHFGYLVWRALRPRALQERDGSAAMPDRRDAAWYVSEAARLANMGRYAEALAHRFTALVLELDARRALKFHPSKTPAEYTVEARLDDEDRGALNELVAALYRHLFGGAPCSEQDLDSFNRRAAALAAYDATG
jgi:hypothetical protein